MKILIDSEWIDRDEKIGVYDPYNGSLIDHVPRANRSDVHTVLNAAEKGCKIAKKLSIYERSQILYKTADILTDKSEEFAQLLARESSKTIREARKEVSRCVNTLQVSGEETKRIHGETIAFDSFPGGENRKGYYYRFPIGIILAITPFNDPLNLVAHKLGPAFAGGNSVILKPATVTPLSAIKLAEAMLDTVLKSVNRSSRMTAYRCCLLQAVLLPGKKLYLLPESRNWAWNWAPIHRLSSGMTVISIGRSNLVFPAPSGQPARIVSASSASTFTQRFTMNSRINL